MVPGMVMVLDFVMILVMALGMVLGMVFGMVSVIIKCQGSWIKGAFVSPLTVFSHYLSHIYVLCSSLTRLSALKDAHQHSASRHLQGTLVHFLFPLFKLRLWFNSNYISPQLVFKRAQSVLHLAFKYELISTQIDIHTKVKTNDDIYSIQLTTPIGF